MKKNILSSLIILLSTIYLIFGQETTINYPAGPFATFFDDELVDAKLNSNMVGEVNLNRMKMK